MTLIGSYVDQEARVVSVSVEATRQGSYLIVKDRWRAPLRRLHVPTSDAAER